MKSLLLRRPLALLIAAVTTAAAALVAVDLTPSASGSQAPIASSSRVVAHNGAGRLRSKIVGHTSDGQRVTGTFVPLRFVKRGGHLKVRGLVQGVVHKGGGTSTFAVMRTIPVKSINGRAAHRLTASRQLAGASPAAVARTCAVLHLTLGPLDLNLLGLTVHLNQVVLNIDANSTGGLLGSLLCSLSGLLDGGLGGLLGQVQTLLNQILGALNLGG